MRTFLILLASLFMYGTCEAQQPNNNNNNFYFYKSNIYFNGFGYSASSSYNRRLQQQRAYQKRVEYYKKLREQRFYQQQMRQTGGFGGFISNLRL